MYNRCVNTDVSIDVSLTVDRYTCKIVVINKVNRNNTTDLYIAFGGYEL